MAYKNFREIVAKLQGDARPVISVAVAQDEAVLEAIKLAYELNLATTILVGDEAKIRPLLAAGELAADIPIVHEPDDAAAAAAAVALVKEGQAQILMKGLVNTAVFLKAVLKNETGLRCGKMLSHLSGLEIPGQEKLLFLTDAALNTYPTLEEKQGILVNAMDTLSVMGLTNPKVALLAANEAVSPKMPATMDAAALMELQAQGVLPPGVVEGPVAMDVIASADAARHKGIDSKIAGDVDLVLMPNIDTANAVVKTLTHYAHAKFAGIVVGATHPIVLTSRSETPEGKLFSIALALLACQDKQ